jgi:hypothetical protein
MELGEMKEFWMEGMLKDHIDDPTTRARIRCLTTKHVAWDSDFVLKRAVGGTLRFHWPRSQPVYNYLVSLNDWKAVSNFFLTQTANRDVELMCLKRDDIYLALHGFTDGKIGWMLRNKDELMVRYSREDQWLDPAHVLAFLRSRTKGDTRRAFDILDNYKEWVHDVEPMALVVTKKAKMNYAMSSHWDASPRAGRAEFTVSWTSILVEPPEAHLDIPNREEAELEEEDNL